jgi:hypothetical protein
MYSNEFFIQRSFEVVWAVFRVAEHATRAKIRQGLEDRAVDYILAKDMKSLDGLEEIVRLGAQIRDIGQVNANVLLREIGNLRAAMMELAENQIKQLAPVKTPESAPQVEEIFAKPPMKVADLLEAIVKGYGKEFKKEDEISEKPSSTEVTEGKSPAILQQIQDKESGKSPAILQQIQDKESGKSPAILQQIQDKESGKSPARQRDRFEAVVGFKERNGIIMQILEKRSLCHLKDMMGALPGVSERTIRYDIQRLVDKGTIERVGTGGPNSFFRMKKVLNVKTQNG